LPRSLIVAVVCGVFILAGCADGSPEVATSSTIATGATTATTASSTTTSAVPAATTTDPDVGFPAVVVGDNGPVEVPARPAAVVSLSPTATEMLYAIGAGDQVVAADSLSDFPADAPTTSLVAFEPNVEAISEFEPDLVVLSFDPGDVVAALEALGIPTLVQGAAPSLAATYEQMAQLGIATGNSQRAADAIDRMRADIAEVVASVPATDTPVRYYHELDDTYYSIASTTFIGEAYGLLGMVSIADDAADLNFGYPQLSAEFILEADPDLILLADTKCCAQDAAAVAVRPGWEQLSAVAGDAIVELDDNVASRWGPRIVDLLAEVAGALIDREQAG
jgi:iron complex transport system substrate-binding protein